MAKRKGSWVLTLLVILVAITFFLHRLLQLSRR